METGATRVEQVNQLVRAAVVLVMTGGFIYGFIVAKVVNTESFGIAFMTVLTWWFASRDKKQDADAAKAATIIPTPGGPTA